MIPKRANEYDTKKDKRPKDIRQNNDKHAEKAHNVEQLIIITVHLEITMALFSYCLASSRGKQRQVFDTI